MKYIFVAGAPGSKWSSVVKNIYYSPDVDQSDFSDARTYYHDASGIKDLMHLGAYYDPGMEFGGFFDQLQHHTITECEAEFDRPFSDEGVRIVKSHVFAHQIDYLKETWPDCPIILVDRDDDACLGWWVRCGHFDITYPSYDKYYKNLREMGRIINNQNKDIRSAWNKYEGTSPANNTELVDLLGIGHPPKEYVQEYAKNDIRIKVV